MSEVKGYTKIITSIGEYQTYESREEIDLKITKAQETGWRLTFVSTICEGPVWWKLCTLKNVINLNLQMVWILSIEEILEATPKETNYDRLARELWESFSEAEEIFGKKALEDFIEEKANALVSDFKHAYKEKNSDMILKLWINEALKKAKETE